MDCSGYLGDRKNFRGKRITKKIRNYLIVEFAMSEQAYAAYVVHSSWLQNNISWFPPMEWTRRDILNAIKAGSSPTTNFKQYEVKKVIMSLETLGQALAGLRMFEAFSSTDSEKGNFEEVTRRSERKRKWFDDSDEDEEDEESTSKLDAPSQEIVQSSARNFETILSVENDLPTNYKKPKLLSCERVQIDLPKIKDLSQPRPGPSGVSASTNVEKYSPALISDFDRIHKDSDHLHSVEFRSAVEMLLQKQQEQSKQIEELVELTKVERSAQPAWQKVPSFDENSMLSSMPYETDEEVKIFNTRLEDEEFRDLVYNTFDSIGAQDARRCIEGMLRRIFSNRLAVGWSWTGSKNVKARLSDQKSIVRTLKCVVRNQYGPEIREKQVQQWSSDWLKRAKTRQQRENAKSLRVANEAQRMEDIKYGKSDVHN